MKSSTRRWSLALSVWSGSKAPGVSGPPPPRPSTRGTSQATSQPKPSGSKALILFREFGVSALRETAAAKGVQVPVSFMGKIKTTLQLVALGALLVTESWSAFDLPPDFYDDAFVVSNLALLIAAIVSLWSGLAYFYAARKSL